MGRITGRETIEGEVMFKVEFISPDPGFRGWFDGNDDSYAPPVGIGNVMPAVGLGKADISTADGYELGNVVQRAVGWQNYAPLSTKVRALPALRTKRRMAQ